MLGNLLSAPPTHSTVTILLSFSLQDNQHHAFQGHNRRHSSFHCPRCGGASEAGCENGPPQQDGSAEACRYVSSLLSTSPRRGRSSEKANKTMETRAIDKYQILNNDSDFVFDLNTSPIPLVNRKNFPALVGSGMAFAAAEFEGMFSLSSLHSVSRSSLGCSQDHLPFFTLLLFKILISPY